MKFIATLKHSPAHCWAREENHEKAREFVAGFEDRADELGIALNGSYVSPNEHTFYFIIDADDFNAVSEFLGPPLLQDHEGHIAPVTTFGEAEEAVLD